MINISEKILEQFTFLQYFTQFVFSNLVRRILNLKADAVLSESSNEGFRFLVLLRIGFLLLNSNKGTEKYYKRRYSISTAPPPVITIYYNTSAEIYLFYTFLTDTIIAVSAVHIRL